MDNLLEISGPMLKVSTEWFKLSQHWCWTNEYAHIKINTCTHLCMRHFMMTSSNENIVRVTGHLCREFTGHPWIPLTKPGRQSFDVFFDLILNKHNCKAGDLRLHRVHYDVTVMYSMKLKIIKAIILVAHYNNVGIQCFAVRLNLLNNASVPYLPFRVLLYWDKRICCI